MRISKICGRWYAKMANGQLLALFGKKSKKMTVRRELRNRKAAARFAALPEDIKEAILKSNQTAV